MKDLNHSSKSSSSRRRGDVKTKRLQVPLACSNCRRLHTACGVERPCARCSQHGLQSTCEDVARRRRTQIGVGDIQAEKKLRDASKVVLRKQRSNQLHSRLELDTDLSIVSSDSESQSISSGIAVNSLQLKEEFLDYDDRDQSNKLAADASPPRLVQPELAKQFDAGYNDSLFEDGKDILKDFCFKTLELPSTFCSSWESAKLSLALPKSLDDDLFSAFNLDSQSMIPFQSFVSQTPISPILSPSLTTPQTSSIAPTTTQPSSYNMSNLELNSLIQEIAELKEAKNLLEQKLFAATSLELGSSMEQQSLTTSWNSFGSPSSAISVWTRSFDGYVLTECNETFIKLVELPLSVLRDNFSSNWLLFGLVFTADTCDWPKAWKIMTSVGIKDVSISATRAQGYDGFVVQMKEV